MHKFHDFYFILPSSVLFLQDPKWDFVKQKQKEQSSSAGGPGIQNRTWEEPNENDLFTGAKAWEVQKAAEWCKKNPSAHW